MRSNLFILILFTILISANSFSQNIKPFTLNMGGGNISQSFNISWSIGEAPVIGDFNNINFKLGLGVLQATIDLVTGIYDINLNALDKQIKLSPNPTLGDVDINFGLITSGNCNYTIYNNLSETISKKEIGIINPGDHRIINMVNLVAGTYYVKIVIESLDHKLNFGIFKIIKL